MNGYRILRLSDKPALLEAAASWFHENWGIDREIYLASMRESLKDGAAVPRWYLVLDGEKIIAGFSAECLRGVHTSRFPRAGDRGQATCIPLPRYGGKRDPDSVSSDRSYRIL